MKAKLAQIKLEAIDLPVGQTIYAICPFCEHIKGPNHGQAKLSITRTEAGILYNCFRASCKSGRGFIGDILHPPRASGLVDTDPTRKKSKIRAFAGTLAALPDSVFNSSLSQYLGEPRVAYEQGIRYAPEVSRIYFPIYDARGYQIGENLKTTVNAKPKLLIYPWSVTIPLLHFPLTERLYDRVVLVEDQVSSIKINMISEKIEATACALLGTNLSEEGLEYLLDIGMKEAIVFLDGNALSTAIRIHKRLSGVIKSRVVPLHVDNDPKDCTFEELEEVLQ